jgi:hypothetical protein
MDRRQNKCSRSSWKKGGERRKEKKGGEEGWQ